VLFGFGIRVQFETGSFSNSGRWMDYKNGFISIPLVVGRRIAQLVFFETGPILDSDYSLIWQKTIF